MKRNLSDEVLIAIIAVGVIAFAMVFGVVLSLAVTPVVEPPATQTLLLATLVPSATIDFTPFVTFTPAASATETPTATRTLTHTAAPTTPAVSPTAWASATTAASATETPTVTRTLTNTPAPTTPVVSPTARASATTAASATETPTVTRTLTNTPAPTTLVVSPTAWASATTAASATETPTVTRTLTHTATATATATATITSIPSATPTRIPMVVGCVEPDVAIITGIEAGARLSGLVSVQGTAAGSDFRRYRLEIKPMGAEAYEVILHGNTPVRQRTLGILDVAKYPEGDALLRLEVIAGDGLVGLGRVCVIPVVLGGE